MPIDPVLELEPNEPFGDHLKGALAGDGASLGLQFDSAVFGPRTNDLFKCLSLANFRGNLVSFALCVGKFRSGRDTTSDLKNFGNPNLGRDRGPNPK
jgi:hypothetical protein